MSKLEEGAVLKEHGARKMLSGRISILSTIESPKMDAGATLISSSWRHWNRPPLRLSELPYKNILLCTGIVGYIGNQGSRCNLGTNGNLGYLH